MVFATCLVVFFYCCATADILTKLLQQCFLFFIVVVIPGQCQVSVYRTIGPTLVLFLDYVVAKVTMVIDTNRFCFRIKLSYICI